MLKAERQSDSALETKSIDWNVIDHFTNLLFLTFWWIRWDRQPKAMASEERSFVHCPRPTGSLPGSPTLFAASLASSLPRLETSAFSLASSSLQRASESPDAYRWSPQAASFSIPRATLGLTSTVEAASTLGPCPPSPCPSADGRHSDLSGA